MSIREQFEKINERPFKHFDDSNDDLLDWYEDLVQYLEQQIEARDEIINAVGKWKKEKQGYTSIIDCKLIKKHDEYEARQ